MKKSIVFAIVTALMSGSIFAQIPTQPKDPIDCFTVGLLSQQIMLSRLSGEPKAVLLDIFKKSATDLNNPDPNKETVAKIGQQLVSEAYAMTITKSTDQKVQANTVSKFQSAQVSKCFNAKGIH